MIRPWPDIIAHYSDANTASHRAIGQLARHIHEGPFSESLFGWTSLYDLRISQTKMSHPPKVPYLTVSATGPESVEFRYLDTNIADRQWNQTVRPEQTIARFDRFLEQLRWVGGSSA